MAAYKLVVKWKGSCPSHRVPRVACIGCRAIRDVEAAARQLRAAITQADADLEVAANARRRRLSLHQSHQ